MSHRHTLRLGAVFIAAAVTLGACGGSSRKAPGLAASTESGPSGPATTSAVTIPSQSPTSASIPTPTPTSHSLVDYTATIGPEGLAIRSVARVSMLSATSADFRAFIGGLFTNRTASSGPSCTIPFALHVLGYDTRGFAAGSVVTCAPSESPTGEVPALWARIDGQWRDIHAYGTWGVSCKVLEQYAVPVTVLPQNPDCFTDPNNQNTDRPYTGPQ